MRELTAVWLGRIATVALLALIATATGAGAHGASNVRAVLGPLPRALDGMRIEVHHTLAPQLVLENATAHIVEVLDDDGAPFLRVGPRGVEANLAAPAWYGTQGPAMPVPVDARRGAEPRWARADRERSYGWFDPRLDPGDVHMTDARAPMTLGAWTIPLRVDGEHVLLTGTFECVAPSAGRYVPRLTSPAGVAPGVRVRMLPGRHPGLLIENASARPVTVLGEHGEPVLRLGPEGVDANARSTTWQQSGRAGTTTRLVDGPVLEPAWVRVGTGTRYGWVDPRLASPVPGSFEGDVQHWQVPLLVGAERVLVTGELAWRTGERNAPTP